LGVIVGKIIIPTAHASHDWAHLVHQASLGVILCQKPMKFRSIINASELAHRDFG
jgi:hypothetical protein